MSNIPTRERRDVPQTHKQPIYQNGTPQTRPTTQGRANQPPVRQMQRPANMPYSRPAQHQNVRPTAPHSRPTLQNAKQKPTHGSKTAHKKQGILQKLFGTKKPSAKKRRAREHTGLGDFLLAFFIAFVFFGIAAIIVCNALISMFT